MPIWDSANLTLTNPFMRVRLEPRHGGRIVSLVGPGGELTRSADARSLAGLRVPYRFGLLSTQLWQDSYWHNDLCHREWPLSAAVGGPGAPIEITQRGESERWPGVSVDRAYRFTDDPWLDVVDRLDPGGTTGPYLPPCFWITNAMPRRDVSVWPVWCH